MEGNFKSMTNIPQAIGKATFEQQVAWHLLHKTQIAVEKRYLPTPCHTFW